MSLHDDMVTMGQRALAASRALALLGVRRKNSILRTMADQLISDSPRIQQENAADMVAGRQAGLSAALLDRLQLTSARIEAMAQGLRDVAALPVRSDAQSDAGRNQMACRLPSAVCRSA